MIDLVSTFVTLIAAIIGAVLVRRSRKNKLHSIVKWPGLGVALFLISMVSAQMELDRMRAASYSACTSYLFASDLTDDPIADAKARLCVAVAKQREIDAEEKARNSAMKIPGHIITSVLSDIPVEMIGIVLGVIIAGGRPKLSDFEE